MFKAIAAVLLALALFTGGAYATTLQAMDSVGNTVTISDADCTNPEAIKLLPIVNEKLASLGEGPLTAADLKAGSVVFSGKQYGACWFVYQFTVVVLDDSGLENNIFPVDASDFKKATDI